MSLDRIVRRFGLTLGSARGETRLSRTDVTVRIAGSLAMDSPDARHRSLCVCLGARLGIDGLTTQHGGDQSTQRLLPAGAVELADAIHHSDAASAPWLPGSHLRVVGVREHGRSMMLTAASDDSARTLFYAAYRLRPAEVLTIAGGSLKLFRTSGGLGSAVASLLPDFDLDAAQDRGIALVLGYDTLGIFRPRRETRMSEIRAAARQLLDSVDFPYSRRLYPMSPKGLVLGEVCGAEGEFQAANLADSLIGVDT